MNKKYLIYGGLAAGGLLLYFYLKNQSAAEQSALNAAAPNDASGYLNDLPIYTTANVNQTGSILAGAGALVAGIGSFIKNGFGLSPSTSASPSSTLGNTNSTLVDSTDQFSVIPGSTNGINFDDTGTPNGSVSSSDATVTSTDINPTSFYADDTFGGFNPTAGDDDDATSIGD